MRGLTLWQPWATLVALGAKSIETRCWRTDYRGPVAIHAAKAFPRAAVERCLVGFFNQVLWVEHRLGPDDLPRGAIVAVAELKSVWSTESCRRRKPGLSEQEEAFGDYSDHRYAWLLENVRPLRCPYPYRGALSLWAVPADVEARVLALAEKEVRCGR